jgi:drug/metabolite transporter (DMT)-like permease
LSETILGTQIFGISKGTIMIKSLFRISVSVGLIGMALGIFMGIRQDFVLAPAHAHLNLLGFVTMFLSALYYRAFPQAAASRLALYQAVVSIVGAILFPVGIACVLLGGHDRFEPVVVAGALTVFAGMLLFAVIVYRTAGSGAIAAGERP